MQVSELRGEHASREGSPAPSPLRTQGSSDQAGGAAGASPAAAAAAASAPLSDEQAAELDQEEVCGCLRCIASPFACVHAVEACSWWWRCACVACRHLRRIAPLVTCSRARCMLCLRLRLLLASGRRSRTARGRSSAWQTSCALTSSAPPGWCGMEQQQGCGSCFASRRRRQAWRRPWLTTRLAGPRQAAAVSSRRCEGAPLRALQL